jgi:DNA polymerase III alpha subunit (gram-positive type)
MKFIAFDVESGGFDSKERSILTAYFLVFDENFNAISELDLKIKPDGDAPYRVDAGALIVNKINLIEHDKVAIITSEARAQLYNFLSANTDNGKEKLLPVGQNVTFDMDFIFDNLLRKNSWNKFVSYHSLDTAGIAQFFKICGKMPLDHKTKLGSLAEFFNVKVGELHTAKDDTILTVKILKAMMKEFKGSVKSE